MDIPRPTRTVRRWLPVFAVGGALLLAGGWGLALSSTKNSAAPVDRASVLVDAVKRGDLVHQIRVLGSLVPIESRWLPAATSGRVERIYVRPGALVKPDTVLLELSNPELEQSALEAQLQLRAAEAEFANLTVQQQSLLLAQRAQAAAVHSEYRQAKIQSESNQQLAQQGLMPQLTAQLSAVKAEELATRDALEQQRLAIANDAIRAQLAAQRARIDQLRALFALRAQMVTGLRVRASRRGVLEQLPVEVGQQVSPGTNLARVADPHKLKAQLRVPEIQAKDLKLAQHALIDTRNGTVAGQVSRIDPAVSAGTVTVDIEIIGRLPEGARPDLSVEGAIELERLHDVLHIGRPAFAVEGSDATLFRLKRDHSGAERIPIRFGRGSVERIEVSGLKEGDEVVLSDLPALENVEQIAFK